MILTCIVTPTKYMPWFDDNPAFTLANQPNNSLDVFNRDSVLLWSDTLPCELLEVVSNPSLIARMGCTIDIDNDGMNEIVTLPQYRQLCSDQGWLHYYSYDGRPLYDRFAGFPGDDKSDSLHNEYGGYGLYLVTIQNEPAIITEITKDQGAPSCIRLFDADGQSRGSYINGGATGFRLAQDICGDEREELFFLNFYNRMNCASLLVLSSDSINGVSPLYNNSLEKQDNQLAYVLFPVTVLGKVPNELISESNQPGIQGVQAAGDHRVDVYVNESSKLPQACIIYTFDRRLRVIKATENNSYRRRYRELVDAGFLQPIDNWSEFENQLRDAVTYWTDSGWVTEGQLQAVEDLE